MRLPVLLLCRESVGETFRPLTVALLSGADGGELFQTALRFAEHGGGVVVASLAGPWTGVNSVSLAFAKGLQFLVLPPLQPGSLAICQSFGLGAPGNMGVPS